MYLKEKKMFDSTETLLKLKIVQLEGKLLLYESLILESAKMESIQQIASEAKHRMEEIIEICNKNKNLDNKTT
jgi:hypothetical protein